MNTNVILKLAHAAINRGDLPRATVTLLNAIAANQSQIKENNDLLACLAQLYSPKYDDEILNIHRKSPLDHPFLPKFQKALKNANKPQLADILTQKWEKHLTDEIKHHQRKNKNLDNNTKYSSSTQNLILTKRFDRIPLQIEQKTLPLFVESNIKKAILDFDNTIPVSEVPRHNFLETQPYEQPNGAETSSEKHASIQDKLAFIATSQQDNPKVEPIEKRRPVHFKLSTLLLTTCSLLCALSTFAAISWKPIKFVSSQAIQHEINTLLTDPSPANLQLAIDFAEKNIAPDESFDEQRDNLEFLKYYLSFQTNKPISPQTNENQQTPLAQAIKIANLIRNKQYNAAKTQLSSIPPQNFEKNPALLDWLHAMLYEANNNIDSAAIHYNKALNNKTIHHLALSQLALLALTTQHPAAIKTLSSTLSNTLYKNTKTTPIVSCASILLFDDQTPLPNDFQKLAKEQRFFCHLASAKKHLNTNSYLASRELKTANQINPHHEQLLKIKTQCDLNQNNIQQAIQNLQTLKKHHPQTNLSKLQNETALYAFLSGNILEIQKIYDDFPTKLPSALQLRYLDAKLYTNEQNLNPNTWPTFLENPSSDKPQKPNTQSDYIQSLENAYDLAFNASTDEALINLNAATSHFPNAFEPLLLRAKILSNIGKHEQAASILIQRKPNNLPQTFFNIQAALYLKRANKLNPLLPSLLSIHTPNDNTLLAALIEINLESNPQKALHFLKILETNAPNSPNTLLFNALLNTTLNTTQKLENLQKADLNALSYPGLFQHIASLSLQTKNIPLATSALTKDLLTPPYNPETAYQLTSIYTKNHLYFTGTQNIEKILENLPPIDQTRELKAHLHLCASNLYIPKSTHPYALKHALLAQEILGPTQQILKNIIDYYTAKNKPQRVNQYKKRLKNTENLQNE